MTPEAKSPKKVSIAVSDFAYPVPRKGSIDLYSGFGRSQDLAMEIHQRIQKTRAVQFANYRSEVAVSKTFEAGGFAFQVSGRMDGLFVNQSSVEKSAATKRLKITPQKRSEPPTNSLWSGPPTNPLWSGPPTNPLWSGPPTKIEEIKTSFNIHELGRRLRDAPNEHPYCLQLRTYGYFHWLETCEVPDLCLHLVSNRDFETLDISLKLKVDEYEAWLKLRLEELVEEAKLAEKRVRRRKKAAEQFHFPFSKPRSGQVELIQTIEQGMKEKKPMLIQAPTGLGKTVGVLYPTLRDALARGQRAIYLTPKNSQHSVAEDAIERMQASGANIKAMTLTAKSKMCFKNEPICNPDFCEYAKDHYTKVAKNQLVQELAKKKKLTAKVFKTMAGQFEVCPFELQLDAAQEADTVICDYNYVFAPRSALGRLSGLSLDQQGKPNLIIDEAHNLPSRAMDYYSPTLSSFVLEKMGEDIQRLPKKFRKEAGLLLQDCLEVVKSCSPPGCQKPCRIVPPVAKFLAQDAELRGFLSTYLKSDVEIEPRDVVMRLSFYWSEFTGALEFVTGGRKEFFTTFHPHPATIKITCCDASEMLKDCYDDYAQVVGFSATLKPFVFYSRLSGLSLKDLKTAEFVSPFPTERRKVLIIPQISSKYSEREKNYPKVAEAIAKIVSLKRGNYFAFFPSFEFLNRALTEFKVPEGFSVMSQQRNMTRNDIENVLADLAEPGSARVIFAVQGGVFSEGVDYPGDMVIGAFVVGPPLPSFDLERENMREYYQSNYSAGFDYAYTFPAMAKAVQAAGRVIRSETDRGLIVLMDNRFTQASYQQSMPQDWFAESSRELISTSILSDIQKFWDRFDR